MYWIYDISSLLLGLLTVTTFITYGVGGLLSMRWYSKMRGVEILETNEVVGFYFAAVVGFYGITLGLVSVGVWQTFSDADNKSTMEAAAVEALYRDVSSYPEPSRGLMRAKLAEYTTNVIKTAWPQQRRGVTPTGGTKIMSELQAVLFPFEPKTAGQAAIHQEALRQFNHLSELRRLRILAATSGLPKTIWWVIVVGAAASIAFTWLFSVEKRSRHIILTSLYSGLIGMLIFLIAALDNPYRGEVSVGPDAFQFALERMRSM